MFRHIVLFRVYDDVSESHIDEAIAALRSLAAGSGAAEFEVHRSADTRKGRLIVEDTTFSDRRAFEAFRQSGDHARVASQLAEVSDWWIGDYDTMEPGRP